VLLSCRYQQIIRLLASIARMPQAELSANRVHRDHRTIFASIGHQMQKFIWVFDLIFGEMAQIIDGLIYQPIPEQRHELSSHGVTKFAALHGHTSELSTFLS
jgi:hypothetical protein